MARINANDARNIAARHGFPLGADFHTLGADAVSGVLTAAHAYGYRQPRQANGSKARYFHAFLQRVARRDTD